jgi:hypothetical protein
VIEQKISSVEASSFRDPSGFVFWQDRTPYRQVNDTYADNYDCLTKSGLYENLTDSGLLIRHEEVEILPPNPKKAFKVIRPDLVPFVSYPYEWCFSQLKDAALALLKIQQIALDFGMSLKDCSSYNMQFVSGKPVLIDTLSFEKYREGYPWIAYRQFCQHFLAPLALMSYKDIRLNQILKIYIDGVPLDLASSLLPLRTQFKISLLSHIHLHAKSQKHYAGRTEETRSYKMGRLGFRGIIENLEAATKHLDWHPRGTEWADYYDDNNYSSEAFAQKKEIVARFLDRIKPGSVWDLGANNGAFSRIAGDKGIQTVSIDFDPAAVEKNYIGWVRGRDGNILPLLIDLTNPSPGIGWENRERMSLAERGPADAVMALALLHHLAISSNLPLSRIASFFSRICKWLIIEFVPKSDSQVRRLLATREDIFSEYTQPAFEKEFGKYFALEGSVSMNGSERTLYLMEKR